MTRQEMHELALDYLQKRLTTEEKAKVFRLIEVDAEFLQVLSFEATLLRQFEQLKTTAPAGLRKRVQERITAATQNPGKVIAGQVIHYILKGTLPQIAWAVYQPWQRRVFAYE
ncbi:MAG TPA: hypothetical protein GXZ26_04605 [Firmicutes bacterium]|nr:hypothetical protein [Bacillota bacterium]